MFMVWYGTGLSMEAWTGEAGRDRWDVVLGRNASDMSWHLRLSHFYRGLHLFPFSALAPPQLDLRTHEKLLFYSHRQRKVQNAV